MSIVIYENSFNPENSRNFQRCGICNDVIPNKDFQEHLSGEYWQPLNEILGKHGGYNPASADWIIDQLQEQGVITYFDVTETQISFRYRGNLHEIPKYDIQPRQKDRKGKLEAVKYLIREHRISPGSRGAGRVTSHVNCHGKKGEVS